MKSNIEALKILVDAFVEMSRMKSCEVGEKSHALWNSTEFIKREIRQFTKMIRETEEH